MAGSNSSDGQSSGCSWLTSWMANFCCKRYCPISPEVEANEGGLLNSDKQLSQIPTAKLYVEPDFSTEQNVERLRKVKFYLGKGEAENQCNLSLANHDKYAREMLRLSNSMQVLADVSEPELVEALGAFNSAFSKTKLSRNLVFTQAEREALDQLELSKSAKNTENPICSSNSEPTSIAGVGEDFIEQLINPENFENAQAWGGTVFENLAAGFYIVCTRMNQYRQAANLIYHQWWHPAELFKDINKILSLKGDEYKPIRLTASLSALFHDIKFFFMRIDDERDSKEILEIFLQPVLDKLNSQQQEIMLNIFYLLVVGGTVPCLVDKLINQNGEVKKLPVMISLYELTSNYLADTESEACIELAPLLLDTVNYMSLLDFNRTIFKELHNTGRCFDGPEWSALEIMFLSEIAKVDNYFIEQQRLTQGFRTVAELGLHFDEAVFVDYTCLVASYQSEPDKPIEHIDWSESFIHAFADKINKAKDICSEVAFAGRMKNSSVGLEKKLKGIEISNAWEQHIAALEKIHDYLSRSCLPIESDRQKLLKEKQVLISVMAKASANQAGQEFNFQDVRDISKEVTEIILGQAVKVSVSGVSGGAVEDAGPGSTPLMSCCFR